MISITGVLRDYPEIGAVSVVWMNGKLYGNPAAVSKIKAVSNVIGPYEGGQFINKTIKNWIDNPVTALMLIRDLMQKGYKIKIDQEIDFNECPESAVC